MSSVVNIKKFGAVGDGITDDTAAIQAALDNGKPVVVIPHGIYKVQAALRVSSQTTLKVHPSAIIRLADGAGTDANLFLLTNKDHLHGNSDIIIEGGIWDGNNKHNHRVSEEDRPGYTGVAINFINVKNLEVKDLTVKNPDSYSVRLGEVKNFQVEDILLDHSVSRPNQDGIHVGGYCEKGLIRNIKAVTMSTPNDDMVALNADDDVGRVLNLGMKRGPIRDIKVTGLFAEDAYTFIRLLSMAEPIENIVINNIFGHCRMHAVNINNWRFPIGVGNIKHVTFKDCSVGKTKASGEKIPLVDIALNVEDMSFYNIQRDEQDDSEAATVAVHNGQNGRLIVVEGLDKTQIRDIQSLSQLVSSEISESAMTNNQYIYRGQFKTDSAGCFVMKKGSIHRLSINTLR